MPPIVGEDETRETNAEAPFVLKLVRYFVLSKLHVSPSTKPVLVYSRLPDSDGDGRTTLDLGHAAGLRQIQEPVCFFEEKNTSVLSKRIKKTSPLARAMQPCMHRHTLA
ncbi:hypothetical protein BRADI_2g31803v3 [Brachypodium distachyon]|uniref:Uncharacterized protein n=1 Tax=Brachypodium distachyon TaxID=15368 RepID=A0A2K2DBD0_BRADI|nr:hypothetical protein BRADI_2g31803v3 [Brachypodium distachyon]